ncbi:MAG: hypothetical protein HRT65_01770 [Flavobacteriaceae bacterium]|nr:hypothetical protein [Flavobacteriaceae bacterium]
MARKKRHALLNLLLGLTVIACLLAFIAHSKNWTRIEQGQLTVLSGIYHQKIPLDSIQDLRFVAKLPQMERQSGFSWKAREKGIFKDSITQAKVYVFVDDLRQRKLRLTYADSLTLYFNYADSSATQSFYDQIRPKD